MSNPKLPINQINALPLQTPEAAADPGETLIIGGKLLKYWSPSALGIIAAPYAVGPDGVNRGFTSQTLDTTGCLNFCLQFRRLLPTVVEAAVRTWSFWFQPQFDPAAGGLQLYVSLVSGTGSFRQNPLIWIDNRKFNDTVVTGFSGPPDDEVATMSFGTGMLARNIGTIAGPPGGDPSCGVFPITTRGRLVINTDTAVLLPADARVWACMWGSG